MPDVNPAASDVFEIVLEDPSGPKSWLRTVATLAMALASQVMSSDGPQNPGGMIISVQRIDSGEEIFRHIEDMGDDDGHLLAGIQQDLAAMSADEFEARWG